MGTREGRGRIAPGPPALPPKGASRAHSRDPRRRYFVRTPHPALISDVHLWLPFTARLSHEATRRLVRLTDRFRLRKGGVADRRLLDERAMEQLFPGASITLERLPGMPGSVIAWQ